MRIGPLAESILIFSWLCFKGIFCCVVRFVFFVMEKCFKLNAAKTFFDILSRSELVASLGYGNEVEAFANNRFFSV